ncbi:MAG: hypothetical protein ACYDC2_10460 [Solirubrobacteraceae bacterium]
MTALRERELELYRVLDEADYLRLPAEALPTGEAATPLMRGAAPAAARGRRSAFELLPVAGAALLISMFLGVLALLVVAELVPPARRVLPHARRGLPHGPQPSAGAPAEMTASGPAGAPFAGRAQRLVAAVPKGIEAIWQARRRRSGQGLRRAGATRAGTARAGTARVGTAGAGTARAGTARDGAPALVRDRAATGAVRVAATAPTTAPAAPAAPSSNAPAATTVELTGPAGREFSPEAAG